LYSYITLTPNGTIEALTKDESAMVTFQFKNSEVTKLGTESFEEGEVEFIDQSIEGRQQKNTTRRYIYQ
jgi:hypothetical protein